MFLCYWVYFVHLNWASSTWLLLGLIYELKLSPNGCALETHDVHQSTLIGHIEEVHQLSSNDYLHYHWSLFWLCKKQVGFLRLLYNLCFKFILMLNKKLYFFLSFFFQTLLQSYTMLSISILQFSYSTLKMTKCFNLTFGLL